MENLTALAAINSCASGIAESARWSGRFEVFKFDNDAHAAAWEAREAEPVETVSMDNVFLLTGLNELFRIAVGQSANTFTQANTQIGVGDSATAASNAQTDLLASSNKTYVTSDASGGITVGASGGTTNSLIVQATFGSAQGNYAWNEMCVKHGVSGFVLNRAVGSLGTKAAGTTWIARVTLSIT
ncbi:hypothetical protein CCAX7_54450 [Capsulimonas corticalis]|uniref:Uncharacterized protein n=1 Tax=Capsulimonas corticalis TaxID=2219043 RepID=A0A402D5S6_9BACT|nr:hypothetical protein [Capsulimonas corticalis]BDI33394.1 hypothetical protein CCAX7_54450 [Capsulimonas corticalis]